MKTEIFKEMEANDVEQIIFNYDKTTGLKAIITIQDTTLGPALGGCRMWPYKSEDEALKDSIRLATGMTYKCSVAGTDFGGGKSVIIGDPKTEKNEALFRAFGRYVQTLNGRYYSGTDVGTDGQDFVYASRESDYMGGLPEEYGGSGNSAIPTSYGVYVGMKAAAKTVFKNESLKDLTIAVQGVGKVGELLVERLIKEGSKVIIGDINKENVDALVEKYPEIKAVDPDEIYSQECDVFAPCALGAILNDETIPQLKCKIIAGSANNQLDESKHGDLLHEKGILYAPDFVINAGGLIQVADEMEEEPSHDRVMKKTGNIYNILLEIFKTSEEKDIPTYKVANLLAVKRINQIAEINKTYVSN